jgi:RHS repeat-associated protein
LRGPRREEWTLLLAAREFPTLYLRFSKDDRSGLNSADASRKLSGVVRDLRGSPLWRFDEHTGITQKWLYSSSGSCIIGTVDNEAALGFAAGTNAGPLLRLGYRFYDPATGHFTMADPSGRDLHPTRYAGGDPVNSVDPWGLEQYNMMGFDRQNERLYVQVWDDRRPNRPVRVLNYGATNRVLTPEERDGVPVHYDPDRSTDGDDYYYFPEPFPASPRDGWSVHSPYMSSNPRVGPAIRTDARRRVDSLVPAAGFDSKWKKDSSVIDNGYYLHGGVGNTTWGCIRMADEDMLELQATVENATQSFGNSRLHTLEASNWR